MEPETVVYFGALILLYYLFNGYVTKGKVDETNELAKHLLQRQKDNANKVLYLRGFNSDGYKFQGKHTNDGYVVYETISFATELSLIVGKVGHFIKVGIPHYNEEFGIDNIEIADANWKEEVLKLMDASVLIIYRPSFTVGTVWELEQIIARKFLNKTVFCFSKNEDNKTDYKLYRKVVKDIIQLPNLYFGNYFIYFDEKHRAHKVRNLARVPLYKRLHEDLNYEQS